METVRVVDVMSGNVIAISPSWHIGTEQGCLVRIKGLHVAPLSTPQGQLARSKLTLMLLGAWVQVLQTGVVEEHVLVCDILYQGCPIQTHFPEYAKEGVTRPKMPEPAATKPRTRKDSLAETS